MLARIGDALRDPGVSTAQLVGRDAATEQVRERSTGVIVEAAIQPNAQACQDFIPTALVARPPAGGPEREHGMCLQFLCVEGFGEPYDAFRRADRCVHVGLDHEKLRVIAEGPSERHTWWK